MRRCLELAKKGIGATSPNPMVGCIIVHKDKIIGEGWHKKAGTPHAEVNAIHDVKNKALLKDATLYVNLEPCSHFGKTPPCSDLIIQHQIPRVIIASSDPNPLVSGKGIKKLHDAGCEVVTKVLQDESDFLNRRFFTFHKKKRPYIILKWAQTSDSFIAPLYEQKNKGKIFWISNKISKQRVHQWRGEETAILVGVQTIVQDNPQLTTRDWEGKNPLRLIIDPNARTPPESLILSDKEPAVIFSKVQVSFPNQKKEQVIITPFNLKGIMDYCFENQIQSLLVEGGLHTIQSFIDENLWDEARVFSNDKKIKKGIDAPQIKIVPSHSEKIDSDLLTYYFN